MAGLSQLGQRQRKVLVALLVAVGIAFVLPRLRAEYCYLRVISTTGSRVDWFYKLEMLGRTATPVLIRLLGHDEYIYRQFAADSLGRLGDRGPVPRLMEVARDDPDREVRRSAIMALGMIGDARAVPVLEKLSVNDGFALNALAKLGEPGKEALLRYTQSDDPVSQARALLTLCEATPRGDVAVEKQLQQALTHSDARVRKVAATCLPRMLGAEAKERLATLLADPSPEVRVRATEELGKLGDGSGFEVAREILLDYSLSEQLRADAALAISYTRLPEAYWLLRETYERDSSALVRQTAHAGLAHFSPSDVPKNRVPMIR